MKQKITGRKFRSVTIVFDDIIRLLSVSSVIVTVRVLRDVVIRQTLAFV